MGNLWKSILHIFCIALFAVAMLTAVRLIGYGNQTADNSNLPDIARNFQVSDVLQGHQGAGTLQSSQNPGATGNSQAAGKTATTLSGTLLMAGSTSMEKYANALAESFMEKYPHVRVTSEFVGSGAGIEAVATGSADIGNSSRNLVDEEKTRGAVENIVALDGIAVCVDPENTVTNLTRQQLSDIYTGSVTNWSELGGLDIPVVVVGRESGSGTRNAFEEILDLENVCKYANELDSTGAVKAKIAVTPGAIGYVSLDVVDDSVTVLALEGVDPTKENIREGSYFLRRPFVMATKGAISEQRELIQAWFGYVYSEEGQEIASQVGLVTVR